MLSEWGWWRQGRRSRFFEYLILHVSLRVLTTRLTTFWQSFCAITVFIPRHLWYTCIVLWKVWFLFFKAVASFLGKYGDWGPYRIYITFINQRNQRRRSVQWRPFNSDFYFATERNMKKFYETDCILEDIVDIVNVILNMWLPCI